MQRPLLCAGLVSNRMPRNRKYHHHHHHPLPYSINAADDEYIDIELGNSFSPESRSFEFQMCPVFGDEEHHTAIFPAADDLFYKGKLLPLLLPPTLQTLHPSVEEDDFIIMDFASSTNTPLKPCRLSFELSNNGAFFESSTLITNKHPPGKFWSNKLRLIKKCLISKKLKAPRAYLRSLFRREASSSSEKAAGYNNPPGTDHKQSPNGKKTPFPSMGRWRHPIKKMNKAGIIEDNKVMGNHRRSFSFSFSTAAELKRRRSPIKCWAPPSSSAVSSSSFSSSSSSSISFSSSDFYELNFHTRSFSLTSSSDFESSIEAAITHCKQNSRASQSKKNID
ncbi:PREDICTED: probable membrane-associated kinase regulator 4 [Ipomoea nil]|uniref:probable membrane-associated kinase regulator 4 n=1 Tax=Ipomoea nil TaxID=35883 RepID=UPI000901E4FC|nr:PREDICTED: probable membrane-associated kinase regulator 4 [Ipomoea nil]